MELFFSLVVEAKRNDSVYDRKVVSQVIAYLTEFWAGVEWCFGGDNDGGVRRRLRRSKRLRRIRRPLVLARFR